MSDVIQEDGCWLGKESDVWKLYVFACGDAGFFVKQDVAPYRKGGLGNFRNSISALFV